MILKWFRRFIGFLSNFVHHWMDLNCCLENFHTYLIGSQSLASRNFPIILTVHKIAQANMEKLRKKKCAATWKVKNYVNAKHFLLLYACKQFFAPLCAIKYAKICCSRDTRLITPTLIQFLSPGCESGGRLRGIGLDR